MNPLTRSGRMRRSVAFAWIVFMAIAVVAQSPAWKTYNYAGDGVALYAGVCGFRASLAGKDPDGVLQGSKTGALNSTGAHLLSERKFAVAGGSGLAFESESEQEHFSVRVYLVGTTLYQALVMTHLGMSYADAARFLDSFQLIAQKAS